MTINCEKRGYPSRKHAIRRNPSMALCHKRSRIANRGRVAHYRCKSAGTAPMRCAFSKTSGSRLPDPQLSAVPSGRRGLTVESPQLCLRRIRLVQFHSWHPRHDGCTARASRPSGNGGVARRQRGRGLLNPARVRPGSAPAEMNAFNAATSSPDPSRPSLAPPARKQYGTRRTA